INRRRFDRLQLGERFAVQIAEKPLLSKRAFQAVLDDRECVRHVREPPSSLAPYSTRPQSQPVCDRRNTVATAGSRASRGTSRRQGNHKRETTCVVGGHMANRGKKWTLLSGAAAAVGAAALYFLDRERRQKEIATRKEVVYASLANRNRYRL